MRPVSWRGLLALYLPLMFSGMLMTLEVPLITAGIARQPFPELFLAAFGVAFAIALIYEAPVIMVLEASIALGSGLSAYRRLRRAYIYLGGTTTVVGVLLFFTPAYWVLTERVMAIPHSIALAARPALMVLAFWPLPIGWRRLHQGVLIRHRQTAIISVATGVRLIVLGAILLSGLFAGMSGALLGATAMVAGVVVEAMLVTAPAIHALDSHDTYERVRTWRTLWIYYWPLAATTLLLQANRPLITAGIAAARQANHSLAAWPVLLSLVMFCSGPTTALQQVVIAVPDSQENRQRTGRFVLAVGGLLAAGLIGVTQTPLLVVVLTRWFGISTSLTQLITPAARVLAIMPLVLAMQTLLRGRLIKEGRTVRVQRAMLANLGSVLAWVVVGITLRPIPGILLGALALLSGSLTETVLLWWAAHRQVQVVIPSGVVAGADHPISSRGGEYG